MVKLTTTERRVYDYIVDNTPTGGVTIEEVYAHLYEDLPPYSQPHTQIVKVFVSKIRDKLDYVCGATIARIPHGGLERKRLGTYTVTEEDQRKVIESDLLLATRTKRLKPDRERQNGLV